MQLLLTSSLLYMATASDLDSMLTKKSTTGNFQETKQQFNLIQNNIAIPDFDLERIPICVQLSNRPDPITLDESNKKNVLEKCKFYKLGMFACNQELSIKQDNHEIKLTYHSYSKRNYGLSIDVKINSKKDIAKLPLMLMEDDKTFHLNQPVIDNFGDLIFIKYQGVDSYILVDQKQLSQYNCSFSKQDLPKIEKKLRKIFLSFTKHFVRRNYKYALMNQ